MGDTGTVADRDPREDARERFEQEGRGVDVEFDDLIPAPIEPRPEHLFKPGKSGNPSGRPKFVRRLRGRFRKAFAGVDEDAGEDLTRVLMRMASGQDMVENCVRIIRRCDLTDPEQVSALSGALSSALSESRTHQLKAIEFLWREGFGRTPMSEASVKKMAEKLLAAMIAKAEEERVKGTPEQQAAIELDAITPGAPAIATGDE
jgi:hypothetical protein